MEEKKECWARTNEKYESVLARHDKPVSYGTASLKLPPGRTNVLERKARKRENTREKNAMHTSSTKTMNVPAGRLPERKPASGGTTSAILQKVVTSVFAPPAVFAESVSYQCFCKFTHRVPTQTFTTDVEHGPFERKKGARRHAGRTTSTIPASHDNTCCSARPPAGTQPTPHDTNSQRRTVTHRGTKHPHMITRNCAL